MKKVLYAATQDRPVFLLDREVSPEVQDSDLPNLAPDALAAHQPIGEVPLAGRLVVGSCLSNKHAHHRTTKAREIRGQCKKLWHNKTSEKTAPFRINALYLSQTRKRPKYDKGR
ncbi:MAG: hypothetical protein KBF41_16350 [Azonexus sp.]|nr:hypothetical protein [Azonexus sp.]